MTVFLFCFVLFCCVFFLCISHSVYCSLCLFERISIIRVFDSFNLKPLHFFHKDDLNFTPLEVQAYAVTFNFNSFTKIIWIFLLVVIFGSLHHKMATTVEFCIFLNLSKNWLDPVGRHIIARNVCQLWHFGLRNPLKRNEYKGLFYIATHYYIYHLYSSSGSESYFKLSK